MWFVKEPRASIYYVRCGSGRDVASSWCGKDERGETVLQTGRCGVWQSTRQRQITLSVAVTVWCVVAVMWCLCDGVTGKDGTIKSWLMVAVLPAAVWVDKTGRRMNYQGSEGGRPSRVWVVKLIVVTLWGRVVCVLTVSSGEGEVRSGRVLRSGKFSGGNTLLAVVFEQYRLRRKEESMNKVEKVKWHQRRK